VFGFFCSVSALLNCSLGFDFSPVWTILELPAEAPPMVPKHFLMGSGGDRRMIIVVLQAVRAVACRGWLGECVHCARRWTPYVSSAALAFSSHAFEPFEEGLGGGLVGSGFTELGGCCRPFRASPLSRYLLFFLEQFLLVPAFWPSGRAGNGGIGVPVTVFLENSSNGRNMGFSS